MKFVHTLLLISENISVVNPLEHQMQIQICRCETNIFLLQNRKHLQFLRYTVYKYLLFIINIVYMKQKIWFFIQNHFSRYFQHFGSTATVVFSSGKKKGQESIPVLKRGLFERSASPVKIYDSHDLDRWNLFFVLYLLVPNCWKTIVHEPLKCSPD